MFKFVLSLGLLLTSLTGQASAVQPHDPSPSVHLTVLAGSRTHTFTFSDEATANKMAERWRKHEKVTSVYVYRKFGMFRSTWYVDVTISD